MLPPSYCPPERAQESVLPGVKVYFRLFATFFSPDRLLREKPSRRRPRWPPFPERIRTVHIVFFSLQLLPQATTCVGVDCEGSVAGPLLDSMMSGSIPI